MATFDKDTRSRYVHSRPLPMGWRLIQTDHMIDDEDSGRGCVGPMILVLSVLCVLFWFGVIVTLARVIF